MVAPEPHLRAKAYLNRFSLLTHNTPDAARNLIPQLAAMLDALPPGRSQVYAYLNAGQSLLQLGTPAEMETAARFFAQAHGKEPIAPRSTG
ncbi:MAG: hypothetical protein AAFU71_05735 [Cyanobacteria bacterium J06632_22]